MKCNSKVENSGEMKGQKERGKVRGSRKVGESVIVNVNQQGEEEAFFYYYFLFLRIGRIKHILKKNTINLNQSYTKEQKSTKRERVLIILVFLQEKYGLNERYDIEFIQK